ncbi:MAG TPA: hypothetical protein VHM31_22010 [Polyangia bacterium]|nr:hypothetical protein [Polyangia bacterium]
MRAARAAALSLLVASLLAGADCYKPKILSGGFQCAQPDDQCPDNFVCDKRQTVHLCVSSIDGGVGGATGGTPGSGGKGGSATGGTTGAGGTGGKIGTGGSAGAACLPKIANCTTTFDGGACDPLCNVGCSSCDKKCSVNSAGTLTCNAPAGTPANSMDQCFLTQSGGDLSTQTDNCGPGQVCIEPTTCGRLCYRFCRTNADCPGQRCARDLGNGLKVCDVPFTSCDPTSLNPCGSSSLATCYMSQENGLTICDCPNSGNLGRVKETCKESRDCFPGLVCYNPTGKVGDSQCRRACRLPTDGGASDAGASTCSSPGACAPMRLTNNMLTTTWGYCNE